MSNFLKIAEGIDVTPLLLSIHRQSHLWQEDTFLRHYPQGPFGEVETIFLRFPERVDLPEGEEGERQLALYKENKLPGYDQHESVDYPAYAMLQEAKPIVMALMARVGGTRLGRVMLNKVNPGGQIFRHADSPEHCRYWNNRLHVVLQSERGNDFECDGEHIWMRPGEVHWFAHHKEHSVLNNSAAPRIHMIVDIRS